MTAYQSINLGIFAFSAVSLLVILLRAATDDYKKGELDWIFIASVSIFIPILIGEIIVSIAPGSASVYASAVFRGSVILLYILSPLFMLGFTRYVLLFIKSGGPLSKTTLILYRGMSAAYLILVLFSASTIFSDMYFYIEGFTLHPGTWSWATYFLSVAGFLFNSFGVIINFHRFKLMEVAFLFSFPALPVVGHLLHTFGYGGFAIVNIAITMLLLIYYVSIQSKQASNLKEKEIELADSRAAIMLSQIQPHFLYNSLASIRHLCAGNPKAQQALKTFAEYLRTNMDALTEKSLVSFEKELEHIKHYLWLEELRFGEKLRVVYEIETTDFKLPALSVQPIVENAVFHGLFDKVGAGTVTIRAEEAEKEFIVTVADDGVGFEKGRLENDDGRSHIGIENVRSRLAAMCGGALTITSAGDKGTRVSIIIPKGAPG